MMQPRSRRKPATRATGEAFQALVDALPDAMMVIAEGRVAYANDAMQELLDVPLGVSLVGRQVADLVAIDDTMAALEARAAVDGRSDVAWRQPARGPVMTDCAFGLVTWNGQPAIQIVARDCSERLESDVVSRRTDARMLEQLGSEKHRRERAEEDRDAVLARLALTAEHERGRLSRELHDEVGQHLASLLLGLQGIIDVAGIGSEVATRATALLDLAQRLGGDLHDVAVRLRPKALDDFGIDAALRSYAAVWSRESGIEAAIRTTGRPTRLPKHVETALYRIAQEALTNVARHSDATCVSVVLHQGNDLCRLTIDDDGKGFDPGAARSQGADREGLGLLGIRERTRLLGGHVDIESKPGRGTSVFVRIPTTTADPGARA